MSTITRKGLEFIVNQIGKAKFAYKDLIGDTTYVRGFNQDFEKNLLRLKGSNTFNDYDLSKKDPKNLDSSQFTTLTTQRLRAPFMGSKHPFLGFTTFLDFVHLLLNDSYLSHTSSNVGPCVIPSFLLIRL